MADKSNTPLDLPELSSTPSNPGSGYHRFYAKTDGKPYALNSAGIEYALYTSPWVQITQAAYNALSPPDSNTLYIIVG